ncbi:MAG: FHA domain-containing protein, partial [bacterium]
MDTASTPIKFDIYEGNQLVRTEILAEQTIKIGKLSSSHVRIDDDSVSRMHAVIEASGPDDVVILDLGSATGTYVNGERVTKQRLRTGDRIRFGNTTVVVAIAGQTAQGGGASRRPVVSNAPLFDEDEGEAGGRRALEILVLWGVTVVDVRHFTENGSYTIGDGEEASHFVKPQLIPQNPFPLAEIADSVMVVNVPEGVEGEVMLDGKVYAIEELKNAGKLGRAPVPRSHSLKLPPRARCRLKFGELTFLINSVPAAPIVPRGSFLKA